MALYTRNLARKTKDVAEASLREAEAVEKQGKSLQLQAEATTEQAELTRKTLLTSIQPWITLGDEGSGNESLGGTMFMGGIPSLIVFDSSEFLEAILRLKNVGVGLAVLAPKESRFLGWPDIRAENQAPPIPYTHGSMDNPVLQPGEQERIRFVVPYAGWHIDCETLTGQHRNDGEIWIDVEYSDIAQERKTRARFHAAKHGSNWNVFEIEYFTPSTTSDPPSPVVRF